jgi:hypothetical protein
VILLLLLLMFRIKEYSLILVPDIGTAIFITVQTRPTN